MRRRRDQCRQLPGMAQTPGRLSQSCSAPSPRRPWPLDTTLIRARQTGDGSADFPASPTANPSTRGRMASSLSFASRATPASSTRWPRAFVQEITKLYEAREQEREARRLQASLSPQRGPRLSNLSLERFRTSSKYQRPTRRRRHRLLCRRLCQWHGRGPDRTCP